MTVQSKHGISGMILRRLWRPAFPTFTQQSHAFARLRNSKGIATQGFRLFTTEKLPTGLFSRLSNRIRLMLTRRRRRWTRDDLWALGSWLFVGQGLFILVGTTTFASVMLLLANSLQFQDWMARRLARYLAKETGLEFSFGETIVPNWQKGKILFKDIAVKSIGGGRIEVTKFPKKIMALETKEESEPSPPHALYDLTIERAEVTLSMRRFLEGKGLMNSCEIQGVRGTVDRRHLDPEEHSRQRHASQRGDFDLQKLVVKDLLLTFLNPAGFRPYNLSLISAEFPRMRKRFVLQDVLSAESIVGMLDGSLFSMHIPQVTLNSDDRKRCDWMRHLKMHALNVDFFARGATMGPLSWLTRGSVDVDVFIHLPSSSKDQDFGSSLGSKIGALTEGILVQILRQSQSFIEGQVERSHPSLEEHPFSLSTISDVLLVDVDRIGQVIGGASRQIFGPFMGRLRSRISEDILNVDDRALETPERAALHFLNPRSDTVTFKVDFRFHNLRAHLPWTSHETGGLLGTNLMVRPLVAYLNEQRPFIPISCHFKIPLENFDGAWTMYESGIVDALSRGAAESFESLVGDRQKKIRRLKRISLWSLYAIFRNIRGIIPDFYHVTPALQ